MWGPLAWDGNSGAKPAAGGRSLLPLPQARWGVRESEQLLSPGRPLRAASGHSPSESNVCLWGSAQRCRYIGMGTEGIWGNVFVMSMCHDLKSKLHLNAINLTRMFAGHPSLWRVSFPCVVPQKAPGDRKATESSWCNFLKY